MSSLPQGKLCVITGTGGSMGGASALAFAREGKSAVGCDLGLAATVALFLASEDSSYATVAEILVGGGMKVRSLLL